MFSVLHTSDAFVLVKLVPTNLLTVVQSKPTQVISFVIVAQLLGVFSHDPPKTNSDSGVKTRFVTKALVALDVLWAGIWPLNKRISRLIWTHPLPTESDKSAYWYLSVNVWLCHEYKDNPLMDPVWCMSQFLSCITCSQDIGCKVLLIRQSLKWKIVIQLNKVITG